MTLNIATINGKPNPDYKPPKRQDPNRNEPAVHGWQPIGEGVYQYGGIGQIILARSSTPAHYWELSFFGEWHRYRLGWHVDKITAYVKAELAEMEAVHASTGDALLEAE